MAAIGAWAGQIVGNFIEVDVAVIDLDQKLDLQAPDAGRLDDDTFIEITERRV
jgi:hypothetical protein